MIIRSSSSGFLHPVPSDITPQAAYQSRRDLMRQLAAGSAGVALAGWGLRDAQAQMTRPGQLPPLASMPTKMAGAMVLDKLTPYKDAATYNNFYEFGTDKSDPAKRAHTLVTDPWSVEIEGLVNKPARVNLEDLLKWGAMEERIYRLRCVEGWSVLDWPYLEGLRMDEAMHPLTLLAFGMYGEVMPKQNGAPLRLVVPWKYGFKSSKSLVKIRFTDKQPVISWEKSAPQEYGFYSNVNPNVDHPRWSQATERRIGEDGLLAKKRKTLMFNGYETQVGQLYAGMDLKKFF